MKIIKWEIKKLVKDIGNLNNLTIKETKSFFLYDNSNLISNTFFTELNKKIQACGYILLITLKNRLKFNILVDIEKEFITLHSEDILMPKKIETTDSTQNISMLVAGKMNRKIVDEIKIEVFQNFQQ